MAASSSNAAKTGKRIEIQVAVNCEECRKTALRKARDMPGVEMASMEGPERDHLVVIGQRIDFIKLVKRLQKKLGYAEVKLMEDLKPPPPKPNPPPPPSSYPPPYGGPPPPPPYAYGAAPPPPYAYGAPPPPYGHEHGGCIIM